MMMAIEVSKLVQHPNLFSPVAEALGRTRDQLVKLSDDVHALSRQLLYTAVSRARRGIELWTTPAALETALRRPIARQGGLREIGRHRGG